jgi:peptidoglycan/xylan/chitin deacetylase (PgdA/CDA1 family)
MKPKLATLSLDDGGMGDLHLMPALDILKVKATFYLPSCAIQENWYGNLNKQEIQKHYVNHEIGAHSRLHLSLRREPWANVEDEILRCREDLSHYFAGRKFLCYAYPYGETTAEARKLVHAQYYYGRTCKRDNPADVAHPDDPALMPITGIWANAGAMDKINAATDAERPLHVLAHPWEFVHGRWQMAGLIEWVKGVQAKGYQFVANGEFFKETIRGA